MTDTVSTIADILSRLEQHLIEAGFKGFDPFDAMNSRFVRTLTFRNRLLGVAAVQFFKRSPINVRRLFRVKPGINPKGWGLLLSGYTDKYRITQSPEDLEKARFFADWLCDNPSPGWAGPCWGYNFDWPNRNAWIPAYTPTIVNTAYVGEALLDYAEMAGDERARESAVSSANFFLKDLHRSTQPDGSFCFSYTPVDQTRIHNANMLGAALLARIFSITGSHSLKEAAESAMRYSLDRQRSDGSWLYGEETRNGWIDSYHTGYNLLALQRFNRVFPSPRHESALKQGYRFYLNHFFTLEGFVRYYHNRTWPWDAHAAAHAALTLHELRALAPDESDAWLEKVLARICDSFWDEHRNCFLYMIHRRYKNHIDYVRWVQCWMWYALWKVISKD